MQFPSMQVFKASPRKKFGFIFLNGLQCVMLRLSLATGRKPIAKDKPPMSVGGKASTLKTKYTCTHGKYTR